MIDDSLISDCFGKTTFAFFMIMSNLYDCVFCHVANQLLAVVCLPLNVYCKIDR